jgi:hypothetical protein
MIAEESAVVEVVAIEWTLILVKVEGFQNNIIVDGDAKDCIDTLRADKDNNMHNLYNLCKL